jgi:hypothetical protein
MKRRSHKSKKLNLTRLNKKIERIALADRPTYHVYDDNTNDANYVANSPISVGYTVQYKYIGLPFGASNSTPLTGMTQNTQEGDILGNQVRLHSMSLRGEIYLLSTTILPPDFTNTLRYIVYWDRECTTYSNVWNFPQGPQHILGNFSGASTTIVAPSVFSHYNPITAGGRTKRFQVLRDRTITLSSVGDSAVHRLNFKIKLRKLVGLSQSTSGAVLPSQWIGIAFVSDSSVAPFPTVSIQTRLCYST